VSFFDQVSGLGAVSPGGQPSPVCVPLLAAVQANVPQYAHDGDAGMDLHAALAQDVTLLPGQRQLIPTGISLALPKGLEAQVRPRSGLAVRHGLTVLNTPGTVDASYRGEVKVLLINLGHEPFVVQQGMKIAQLVVAPYVTVQWQRVEKLPETVRGEAGFGSTGV
jgi:dUTP pyrophosphatase